MKLLHHVLPAALALGISFGPASASEAETSPVWKFTSSIAARATFDSNVYLQDQRPDAGIAGAVRPRQESFASSLSAAVSLDYRPHRDTSLSASYAPEASRYFSARSEDHRLHRLSFNGSGRFGAATWSLQNSGTWIDGSAEGPTFGGIGGITAMGGIPLRDRREAYISRHSFRMQIPQESWFVRPVASAYVHDFQTVQSRRAGYENYLDRQEWTAGVDLGRKVGAKTAILAGWRMGRQDQLRLHGIDSPYDSRLRRWLVGVEGAPASWLQCAVLTGPETRDYPAATPVGFKRDKVYWWIDASATVTAGPRDICTISARRFGLPAFASQSMYEDITYEMNWRHRFGDRLGTVLGFRAYGGDWPGPACREDWILTPSAAVQYAFSRRCGLELAYVLDSTESRVPNTSGREYRRQLATFSLKFTP
ncbi:MAG: hypothetical protein HZC55_06305 [Verrucomicrobia bacterium]|nr:hypothetical protein [Verrucomicrobiota bacterium]